MPFTGEKIPTGYARQLAKNYKEQKLGSQLLKDDSQAVWFSREVLLEALNLPATTTTPGISGLRIYFGAYENNLRFPKDPTYRRMLTLIIVQTEIGDDGTGKVIHKDVLEHKDDPPSYPAPDVRKEFNDGQICPPPLGCGGGLLNGV